MWVRFWADYENKEHDPMNAGHVQYEWVSDRETDSSLEEWSREIAERHIMPFTNYHYYWGWDKLRILTEKEHSSLVTKYLARRNSADKMLKILNYD